MRCLTLVGVLWALTACDAEAPPSIPQGAAAEPAALISGLPAWETPGELAAAAKGDEHDDYRAAHPELYGVTAPPSEPVGSFAEFAPVQALVMRPGGSIGAFHKGILQGAAGHVERIVIIHGAGKGGALLAAVEALGLDPVGFQFLDVGDTDAVWTRDYGPISHLTLGGEVGFVDFRYYHGRHWDDAVPTKLAAAWGINVFRPSMSYEGGNFMADAAGTCYATEKIYQQNAGHSEEEIDQWMREYAGCRQIVSLIRPKGLGTGHIDMFAKLMDSNTVIVGAYDPALQAENAALLDEDVALLEAVTTEGGESLQILRIPLPWDESGIWYTYTNSLIVNDTVLVPVYSKFKDLQEQALAVYETAAPQLSIHVVNSDATIPSGGAIHCVTMTVPTGILSTYQLAPVELCPDNEINECDDVGPCGGLPEEGVCKGEVLQFCGADGYPHAAACESCCGWDPAAISGLGWYNCLAPAACEACADECAAAGESGCSAALTHAWTCGQFDDDPCLERGMTGCGMEALCNPESGACEVGFSPDPCEGPGCDAPCLHQCEVPGGRTCSEDGAVARVCREDRAGCRILEDEDPCDGDTTCIDGVCVTLSEDPVVADLVSGEDVVSEDPPGGSGAGGCAATAGSAAGGSLGWLLLAAMAAVLRVGRGSPRPSADVMTRGGE